MSENVVESPMTLEELQERRNKTAGEKQEILAKLADVRKLYKVLNKNMGLIRQKENLYDELEVAIKRHDKLKEEMGRR